MSKKKAKRKDKAAESAPIPAARTFQAAMPSTQRKRPIISQSPDAASASAGPILRGWGRYLDENHDLAVGVLDCLTNTIVGEGLHFEPMAQSSTGRLLERVNGQLRDLLDEWYLAPDVTGELPWTELERLVCRSWLRDGDVFAQHVEAARLFQYPMDVPYALEAIEGDLCPHDWNRPEAGIVNGILRNAWRQPAAYFFYKEHPGNAGSFGYALPTAANLKQIDARQIIHLKFARRLMQTRGISIFHAVITRLDDLKDYHESERLAARIAAAVTLYIKRNPDLAGAAANIDSAGRREFVMEPALVWDNLLPGEDVGMINSQRPNAQLGEFTADMLRGVAAGTGTAASSISKRYDASYSAMRQENVESRAGYMRLRDYLRARFLIPVYRRFVDMALASGALSVPRSIDMRQLYRVAVHGGGMPWIDPYREMQADALAIAERVKSRHQVIRERNGNPRQVDEEIAREREEDRKSGMNVEAVQNTQQPEQSPADGEQGQNEAA